MYFDPLTTWLVALIADGIVVSGNHVPDYQMAEYYQKSAKRINETMNGSILSLRNNGYVSAENALKDIKSSVEWAQKSYEIRLGYGKLELSRESYDFIIHLCEESHSKLEENYRTYSRIYQKKINKGETEKNLTNIRETMEKYRLQSESYKQILDLASKGRDTAIRQEEENALELAAKDSSGMATLKCILVILICIVGFVMLMAGHKLIGAIALIGAAAVGYFILKKI